MTRPLLGIWGAGGCGRGIMPLARRQYVDARLAFVADDPDARTCNGAPVMTLPEFIAAGGTQVALAIADPAVRRRLARRCEEARLRPLAVTAADWLVMDDVEVGEGALISPHVTFTSNIRIGRHFHCNLYSYVEHDCRIGDFVTFAPGVRCNGNVTIGDGAYLGAGAMIRQGIAVGPGAVVGMGAVVVKDVAAGQVVAGNPARPL